MDEGARIQEKLDEYRAMLGPLERAEGELALARRMLRARTEDELHQIAPALAALSDALRVSTLDMLLAEDRMRFLQEAVDRSGLHPDEIRRRVIRASSTAREDLKLLGFGEEL